ncbi:hypothetical protein ACSTI3_23510, partial [Vibrio parahaemolyticus]
LLEDQRIAQETWSEQRESLRRTLTAFLDRWPSPNLLADPDASLTRALREIRDRIAPINDIMRDLPFYDDEHRLQIVPRESQS